MKGEVRRPASLVEKSAGSHTPGLGHGLFCLQRGDCPLDIHVGFPKHRVFPELSLLLFSQPVYADGQPQARIGFSQSTPCQALTEPD